MKFTISLIEARETLSAMSAEFVTLGDFYWSDAALDRSKALRGASVKLPNYW